MTPPVDQRSRGRWPAGRLGCLSTLFPMLIYALISFLYFGRPLIGHFTTRYIGSGPDPTNMFMWSLAWWPYALTHGVNPFLSGYIWAPLGFNVTWLTSIPFLSLLMAPATALLGPVGSYNLLMMLAPVLGAFFGFVLIRKLSRSWWVGLWGGYIFGFSSYELGQMLGHPNLAFEAFVPLMIYIVLSMYERRDQLRPWWPPLAIGLVLTAQFATSSETFATVSIFGLLFLGIAWLVVRPARPALRWTLRTVLLAYGVALVLLTPILVFMFRDVPFSRVLVTPAYYSTDLLNMVVPTKVSLLGPQLSRLSADFTGNTSEQGAYLGLPLLILLVSAVVATWRSPWMRAVSWTLMAVAVASLGPLLHVAGVTLGPVVHRGHQSFGLMPWALFSHLPLIGHALPSRFTLFIALLAAIVAGEYLRTIHWGIAVPVALLSVILLLPNLSGGPGLWWSRLSIPRLISSGQVHRFVAPGATVLALPAGAGGNWMLDQAMTGFSFRLEESYPYVPLAWQSRPMARALFAGRIPTGPQASLRFRQLLAFGQVQDVLSLAPASGALQDLADESGLRFLGVHGGVAIWQVPLSIRQGRKSNAHR